MTFQTGFVFCLLILFLPLLDQIPGYQSLYFQFPVAVIDMSLKIGVLGSSAVSTASQTTRLGKGSSVMAQDECMP